MRNYDVNVIARCKTNDRGITRPKLRHRRTANNDITITLLETSSLELLVGGLHRHEPPMMPVEFRCWCAHMYEKPNTRHCLDPTEQQAEPLWQAEHVSFSTQGSIHCAYYGTRRSALRWL